MPESLKPVPKPELTVVGSEEPTMIDHVPGMEAPADGQHIAESLGGTAMGGKYGNGVIPVENPGPQAIRQAASLPGSPIKQVSATTFVKKNEE